MNLSLKTLLQKLFGRAPRATAEPDPPPEQPNLQTKVDLTRMQRERQGEPAPEASAADAGESPVVVGLRDIVDSGWFNADTREICPGVVIEAGDVVVDVGCGDGGAVKFCANQGAHVVFLDIDAQKVRSLEEQARKTAAGSVRGITGTGDNIDVEDGRADKVICTEVLEHVDDPGSVMAEMVRIGKPGAVYLITVPHAAGEAMMQDAAPPQYFQQPNHVRIFDEPDFRQLIEDAGLEITRYEAFGAFWSVYFSIFWPSGDDFARPSTDALVNWSKTWQAVLNHENGHLIKSAMDQAIPAKQLILASKPA